MLRQWWQRLFAKPKLYVVGTNTFGMKRWLSENGLVSAPRRAKQMTRDEANRFVAVPTCSPIIDWTIEDAPVEKG
jgi:hypothetical protein